MNNTFRKNEKLKSKKLIEQMFVEGRSVSAFPLRLVYLETSFDDGASIKTGVSVSKRNFKKAIGHLYKAKKILIEKDQIKLI